MRKRIIRTVIAVVAVLLMGIGLMNGDYNDVKNKAIKICLECIGIG